MSDVYVYDTVRTPRGRGKRDGRIHDVTQARLAALEIGALRWGFPAFSGGVIALETSARAERFATRASELAAPFGPHFATRTHATASDALRC